jgi:hypothetical protein
MVEQKEKTLYEVRRILTPGGSLHLLDSTATESSRYGPLAPYFQSSHRLKDNSEERILTLMNRAGLLSCEKVMEGAMLFGSLRIAYFHAFAPMSGVPPRSRAPPEERGEGKVPVAALFQVSWSVILVVERTFLDERRHPFEPGVRELFLASYAASATIQPCGPAKGLCSRKRHAHSRSQRCPSSTLYRSPPPGVRRNSPAISAAKGGRVWVALVQKSGSKRRDPPGALSRMRWSSSKHESGLTKIVQDIGDNACIVTVGNRILKRVALDNSNARGQRTSFYAATGPPVAREG